MIQEAVKAGKEINICLLSWMDIVEACTSELEGGFLMQLGIINFPLNGIYRKKYIKHSSKKSKEEHGKFG